MLSRGLKRIVVGMSGGVDSALVAWLLQRQGHHVSALFVQSWDTRDETGECQADSDWRDVQRLCGLLGIECERQSFVETYWTDVFAPMIAAYEAGVTPNPDVWCNRHLKFTAVTQCALRDADLFATGHYARLASPGPRLLRSPAACDQTLFLSGVSQQQLERVAFPIGHLTKEQVRHLAREAGLPNAERRTSTGICFVGKRRFGDFLAQYAQLTPGDFVDIDSGLVLGEHNGAQQFTVGQRARIAGLNRPLYVSHIDAERGIVAVAPRHHPSFRCDVLSLEPIHWIAGHAPERELARVQVQCRHMDVPRACRLELDASRVVFDEPAPRVAPGQTVALYDGEWCLGSAEVRRQQ